MLIIKIWILLFALIVVQLRLSRTEQETADRDISARIAIRHDIITLLSNQANKVPLAKFKDKPISFDLKGLLD